MARIVPKVQLPQRIPKISFIVLIGDMSALCRVTRQLFAYSKSTAGRRHPGRMWRNVSDDGADDSL